MERPSHIAVVPVVALNSETQRALDLARTLTPRVIALHVRHGQEPGTGDLEDAWSGRATSVPLIVFDAGGRDWNAALQSALDALRRAEQPRLLTVVLPADVAGQGSG